MNIAHKIVIEKNEESAAPAAAPKDKAPRDVASAALLQREKSIARAEESLRRIRGSLTIIEKHITRAPTDAQLRHLQRIFEQLKERADNILHRLGKKNHAHDDGHSDDDDHGPHEDGHHDHHGEDNSHSHNHNDPGLSGDLQHFGVSLNHLDADVKHAIEKTAHHLCHEGEAGAHASPSF
jgi:hypothetical protein